MFILRMTPEEINESNFIKGGEEEPDCGFAAVTV
jgi:glutaredoxin-related protein